MPSNAGFDPFRRFRLRAHPVPTIPSSSEEDSDESSPERDRLHIIHVPAPKNGRKSGERLVSIPGDGKTSHGAPEKPTESTHITLTLDKPPPASHPERPSKKPSKSCVASVAYPSGSVDALQPPVKSTLIRRMTSKLNISISSRSSIQGLRSRPSTRTLPGDMQGPRSPRATIAVSPTLPNNSLSKERREAALRECGLRPPRKDFSQQERDADKRLGSVPSPASTTSDGFSEAERLKTSWLAMNQTSESSDSDCGHPVPPHLQRSGTRPRSMVVSPSYSVPPPDADVLRLSGEEKADLPPTGIPSIYSSGPLLPTHSYLEVLHEDPSEQAPITPLPALSPANLPITVSTTFECLSSSTFVESPTSFTFSSHYGGSTLESQSQSDHSPPVPEKENIRSFTSRRRTGDSGDRGRKVVGSSLSSLGTRSLSNLRRSVAGSLKLPSSSTLSSDLHPHSMVQAPRTAISPTIHSIGSILRETGGIEDVESRRLSELAFLD